MTFEELQNLKRDDTVHILTVEQIRKIKVDHDPMLVPDMHKMCGTKLPLTDLRLADGWFRAGGWNWHHAWANTTKACSDIPTSWS